jgi:hypothetical protein
MNPGPTQHRVENADDETVRNRAGKYGAVAVGGVLLAAEIPSGSVLGLLALVAALAAFIVGGPWLLEGFQRASLWWATRDYPARPEARDDDLPDDPQPDAGGVATDGGERDA